VGISHLALPLADPKDKIVGVAGLGPAQISLYASKAYVATYYTILPKASKILILNA
jgi:hypothetical protein